MKTMSPEERFERIDRRLEWMSGVLAELVASSQRHDAQITQTAQATAQNVQLIAQNAQQISQLAGDVRDLAHVTAEQGKRMEEAFKRMDERRRSNRRNCPPPCN